MDLHAGLDGGALLGALVDLGAPGAILRDALARLRVPGLALRVSRPAPEGGRRVAFERRKGGIPALRVLAAGLDATGRAALERLRAAASRVRGARVSLPGLGGIEAVAEIACARAALRSLEVSELHTSPVGLPGRLPDPLALELLRGWPTAAAPEGAAISAALLALLRELGAQAGPPPPLSLDRHGLGRGAGGALVRALLGASAPTDGDAREIVSVLETHVDDATPEELAYLVDALLAEGALDAGLQPLVMKKGRPGQVLRVIARPGDRDRLVRRILLDSTTLGVRMREEERWVAPRRVLRVSTPLGPIAVKVAQLPDGSRSLAPEFEDCARIARETGVPLRRVYEAARLAAEREIGS